MAILEIANQTGGKTAVPAEELDALASQLRGPLIRAGDRNYDEARRLWNGMFDKRPAASACCHGGALGRSGHRRISN